MDSVISVAEIVDKDVNAKRPPGPQVRTEFSINWFDVGYAVERSGLAGGRTESRKVLRGVSGSIRSSEMTALMGPSGAGKSVLLECISGIRTKGRTGKIRVYGREKITMAFIPQQDHLNGVLTVREAILLASRLQHSQIHRENGRDMLKNVDHRFVAKQVIEQLGLETTADTRINLLSGGQLKRVSIGQELVSQPQVLIMDEPTSGLDSSSCHLLIEMLATLTQKSEPMAILMTIHQPSARVFNMFHKVYILSVAGRAIYEGHASDVVPTLSAFDINCSQFYNPADLIIEVACGDYEMEVVHNLANNLQNNVKIPKLHSKNFAACIVKPKTPLWGHFVLLFLRHATIMARDPLVGVMRFVFGFMIALIVGLLYMGKGRFLGCPPEVPNHISFDDIRRVKKAVYDVERSSQDNVGSIFFLLLYAVYANLMPKVIHVPLLVKIFQVTLWTPEPCH